jgi:O-antigen/teichoic acid export membrane protein
MSTVNVVLSAFLGGILLVRGGGLRGLVYGYIGSAFVTVFLYLMLVKRLLPQVALRLWQFDRWEAKKMFGYSLRLYVTQAAVAVHNQIEKVFLAMFVGVAPAGLYDISSDIALKIRGSMGMILTPVLPAASELNALSDESRMRELYYRSHKYLALIGVPVVCYVISVSSRFAELWLGGSMITIALPLSILLLANFLNLVTGPGFFIFAGSGYMKPGIQSAMLGLTLNVVLSLGLIYKFGFAGAVAGTFTSLVIASGYFMWMFHQHTGYSILRVLRESYLKPICSSIVILALLLAIHPARDLSWIGLAVMGVAFGSLYGITILYSRFFDEYDWMKIGDALPLARQARRIFRFA